VPENIKTIDEYITGFSPEVQEKLIEIRNFIKSEAPEAIEKISYGMPAFYLKGNLIHFAAFKDNYGFFPSPSGIDPFEKKLSPYRTGKGTLQFELNKELPWDIIKKVIQFRKNENIKNDEIKRKSKKLR
jgi:uncharacterized protein YdhG (YjbR/CyaY superfamily)